MKASMRSTVFMLALVMASILPATAKASVCHVLADYAEELMRQHQFPGQRATFDVFESARRTRNTQMMEYVDKLQRVVWSHDRYITESRRREVVHSFSQEIYDQCASSG